MKLSEEHVAQAGLVAALRTNLDTQRRQINELNKLLWLSVKAHGGTLKLPFADFDAFPANWSLSMNSDNNEKVIVFIAGTKPVDSDAQKN